MFPSFYYCNANALNDVDVDETLHTQKKNAQRHCPSAKFIDTYVCASACVRYVQRRVYSMVIAEKRQKRH